MKKVTTFIMILSLLCQNIIWAYGQDKLAKGAGSTDKRLVAAATALQEMLGEARRGDHIETPSHLDAMGAVTDAIARGEITRQMGEQILKVLEGQGLDGLRRWYEENKAGLTEATRMVFSRLLTREQAVLTSRRIYLVGRKEFHLPHELVGRVIVETDETKEWVRLVDKDDLNIWLEISRSGDEYFISIPGLREKLVVDKRSTGLVYNDIMAEFVDRVIQRGYNPRNRAKAIKEYLVAEGNKKKGFGKVDMGDIHVELGEFYHENRDAISIYRNRGQGSRYVAIVDKADPENYIVLERRTGSVYLVYKKRIVKLPAVNKRIYLTRISKFKEFDLKIPRPIKSVVVSGSGSAALGHTTFSFYTGNPMMVERRQGATLRGEEWTRDKITFKDKESGKIIAEIQRVGIDRFSLIGDGKSVILVGNHIYLNRIIWDFPEMVSNTLKEYFPKPKYDRKDMPSYRLFKEGVIIREGYPYTDIPLDADERYRLYTDLCENSPAVKALSKRQREVLKLRLGSDSKPGLTLEEIGDRFGVTREAIRVVEEKAIRKWRRIDLDKITPKDKKRVLELPVTYLPIGNLNLHSRAVNILEERGVKTIGELLKTDLDNIGLGRKTKEELRKVVGLLKEKLGMVDRRIAGDFKGFAYVELVFGILFVCSTIVVSLLMPDLAVWIAAGLGVVALSSFIWMLLRRIESIKTDRELLKLVQKKVNNRVFTLRSTARGHEYKVYESNSEVGRFEVKYEKGIPVKAKLVLGGKKKRDTYELNNDEIKEFLLNKLLSRRKFVKGVAWGSLAGAVAGLVGWRILGIHFIEPKRALSPKELEVIEELKRLALEIEDSRLRRYAVDFVNAFIENGRILDSPRDINESDMVNILFRYNHFDRSVYMNYQMYRLEGLNKFLSKATMVHEGKHVTDYRAGGELYKKDRAIEDAWRHLLNVKDIDVNTLKTKDLIVDSDGNWKKFPDADFYAYQLILLQLYRIANGEVSAYIEEYNFFRSVFGDLRKYLNGFKRDKDMDDLAGGLLIVAQRGEIDRVRPRHIDTLKREGQIPQHITWEGYIEYQAKLYLHLLMENLFAGAIREDGSLDTDVVKRNYLVRIVQDIGDMRQKGLLSDALFIEYKRGTISYTPSNGLPYTVIDEERFFDWVKTGVFVDKDGTRIDLMGLDLKLSQHGAMMPKVTSNAAVATRGMYAPEQHEKTNERIRSVVSGLTGLRVSGLAGVRVQDVRPEVWASLDDETRQALEDVMLFLLPPEDLNYPYYLRVEGKEYQVAHAGTNRGQGRYIYMTQQAFMELPVDIVARILKREVRLAGERYRGRDTGGYDDEVRGVLEDIKRYWLDPAYVVENAVKEDDFTDESGSKIIRALKGEELDGKVRDELRKWYERKRNTLSPILRFTFSKLLSDSDLLFSRFLEKIEEESKAKFRVSSSILSIHDIRTVIGCVLKKYPEFNVLADMRPDDNKLLRVTFTGHDMAVKRVVNPGDKPLVGIYGGAGADISNFLLSTNASEGYFVDIRYGRGSGDAFISSRYKGYKYVNGYAHNEYIETACFDAIIAELSAIGVSGEDIRRIRAMRDEYEWNSGNITIEFMWAYPGQEPRKRTIHFVRADITNPSNYPSILRDALTRGIDFYYQRGGMAIGKRYDYFIEKIIEGLRSGGFLITDDKLEGMSRIDPTPEMEYFAGLIGDSKWYGWDEKIYQKMPGGSNFPAGGEAELDYSELFFYGDGIVIEAGNYNEIVSLSRQYADGVIERNVFIRELGKRITGDSLFKDFIVESLAEGLGQIVESIDKEMLIQLLFEGIFGNRDNNGDIIIRRAKNLPRNSSRYYAGGVVIVVFNSGFIDAIRVNMDRRKAGWLFCERLFHELYHKNTSRDSKREEERVTFNCDLILYERIGRRVITEEDLQWIKYSLQSGRYFRYLQFLVKRRPVPPPPSRGPLDGYTILRYADSYDSIGGLQTHLQELNRTLLERSNVTIIQMYITYDEDNSSVTEEQIGRGRLIKVPILVKKKDKETAGVELWIYDILKDFFNRIGIKTFLRDFLYRPWVGVLLRRIPLIREFYNRRFMGLEVEEVKRRVLDIFGRYKVDLAMFHSLNTIYCLGPADMAKEKGIPVLIQHHGKNNFFDSYIGKRAVSLADGIGGVNGIDVPGHIRPRFVNLSDGIDTEFFKPEKAKLLDLGFREPVILLPARIEPDKGHLDLVKIASILRDIYGIRIKIIFAGPSGLNEFIEDIKRLAKRYGLLDDIIFTGPLSQEELRDYYAVSSVVVLPSKTEGLGRVLLEAQAMGKPVVAYNVGGVPEAICSCWTGSLIGRGDLNGFAIQLASLLKAKEVLGLLGEQARRFVEDRFSLKAMAERHEKFYLDILRSTNPAVATAGMYTREQHKRTNEKIRSVVSGLTGVRVSGCAGLRVQDARPEVWDALDADTRQALEDVTLFLLPPEDLKYPYYLRVEGAEYQVAHAGTNRGEGKFVYMTEQAFMKLPAELVARILKREVRLAGERFGYRQKNRRPNDVVYDDEVAGILREIPGPERDMYIYLKGKFGPAVVKELVTEGMRLTGEGVLKGGATVEQLAEYLVVLKRNNLNPRRQGPIRLIYHKGAKFNIRDRYGKILGSIQDLIVLKQGTSVEGGTGYRHMKKHFLEFKGVSGEEEILDWLVRTIKEGYIERYTTSREGKGSLDVMTFNLYREETEQAYRAVLSEDYSVMTFYPENFRDYGLSKILGISQIETLLLVKCITGRIPVTIEKSFSSIRGIQDLLAGYYKDERGVLKRINRRIYFYPETGTHEASIGIWDTAGREMILMSLAWTVSEVLQEGVLADRERIDITGKVGQIDSYLLRENEGGKRRFFRKDLQDTNTAVATPGMYTPEQHKKTNEMIRSVVSGLTGLRVNGLAGLRVQDVGPEVWASLDSETRQALVDVVLFLLPPEDPEYPYYLRVDGKEFQVAHAGTNKGKGRYVYMTEQAFMKLPAELVGRILRREARLIGKRDIASYDEEVEALLLDIELAILQWNGINRTRILLALIKKYNTNLTLIRQELADRYGTEVDTETLREWIYKNPTIAPVANRLRKLSDRFHSSWDVVRALQERARQGQENTINALRNGPSKDWPLYFAVKHFGVELPLYAEKYPTRHAVLEGLEERKRQGLTNDWETLKRKRKDSELYRSAVRFGVFVPYRVRAKVMQDVRLGFAEKEFYLAPELLGKVYIERGINEVRLVDMVDPSNWLGFSLRGGKVYAGEERLSLKKGREQHIEANPLVIEFVYEVLKRFYGKGKKEALLTYLKTDGLKATLDDRHLVMHRLWINLPRLYEESPGVVTAYRERDKLIRFYALVQTDDPDNYIIFVYKDGDVYVVEDDEDIKLRRTGRNVYPLKSDQFKAFDLRIRRPTKEIIRAGGSAASLGQASIGFSSQNVFTVERRKGAIYREEEWSRDTIILKDVKTGEKVTEIERVGYDEYRIEGLEDSNGNPIVVVTNYINLSTLVWDFPQFSSDRLKRYFSRTDETGFGGPDRIVRYSYYPKANTIIRDGYIPGRYYSVEKLYKRLPEEYRVLISCELLIQVVSSDKLPDEWPRLADLMARGDVEENGELVKEIGDAVEDAARYTGLTKEKKVLIIEAIAVQALLSRGERLETDLDRLGYRTKRDEIIRRISEIRRRKREGKLSRIDYDFLLSLEELLGYPRGRISFNVHSSRLKGKADDRVERLKDIFELNLLQWELGELARDKKPTGVIVQHIKELGPGVANWLEGLKRYNVDMSNVRMAYVVDGVSQENRRRLFASKPPDVILVNSLEEIEGESIVYLARAEELQKVKKSGVVLVKREFGPVIDLSLCLLLLGTDNEEETRRGFMDEMERIGILPKIEKVLQMWDELGEGATYLDVWA